MVSEISHNYRLIAGYFQRPAMNDKFAARATKLSEVRLPWVAYELRSEFFFDWLGPLFVGGYVAFYSHLVLSGHLSLGTFLATISVFKEVGHNFADGFARIRRVAAKFSPLVDLTVFLNRATDVQELGELIDSRVRETSILRKDILSTPASEDSSAVRTDLIPVRLENLSFCFQGRHLLQGVNISVPQGRGCRKACELGKASRRPEARRPTSYHLSSCSDPRQAGCSGWPRRLGKDTADPCAGQRHLSDHRHRER